MHNEACLYMTFQGFDFSFRIFLTIISLFSYHPVLLHNQHGHVSSIVLVLIILEFGAALSLASCVSD